MRDAKYRHFIVMPRVGVCLIMQIDGDIGVY